MFSLTKNLSCYGPVLFIKELNLLVISDLQLGQEEELRSYGSFVLDKELISAKERLKTVFEKSNATRLLINGDIKHEFSRINKQEWDALLELFSFIKKQGIELILVKGNHDNMLEPIIKKANLELLEYYLEDGFLFCHGDIEPKKSLLAQANTVVIGHEHPALGIDDGVRVETMKAFLLGKYKNKELIILPSFSEVTQGTNILTSTGLGPFLENKESFSVYGLVNNEPLAFGTVAKLSSFFKNN